MCLTRQQYIFQVNLLRLARCWLPFKWRKGFQNSNFCKIESNTWFWNKCIKFPFLFKISSRTLFRKLILTNRLLAERQMYDEAKEKKEQMEEFRVEVRALTKVFLLEEKKAQNVHLCTVTEKASNRIDWTHFITFNLNENYRCTRTWRSLTCWNCKVSRVSDGSSIETSSPILLKLSFCRLHLMWIKTLQCMYI